MSVDLHAHSTASDGLYTPEALVRLAQARGLRTLALTDHDTTNGIAPAQQAASPTLTIIPGIELSTYSDGTDIHILGYYFTDTPALQRQLTQFRQDRVTRGQQILAKLASLGVPVEWTRVEQIAAGGAIGRPHIAQAMVEAKHVISRQEAFDRYLDAEAPAYVARTRLTPEAAIQLLHDVGGVAVLAHPGLIKGYQTLLGRLVSAGLDGVEVVHPKHDMGTRETLRGLAKAYKLIATGGSDFHGPDDDGNLSLGMYTPPPGCVAALKTRTQSYR